MRKEVIRMEHIVYRQSQIDVLDHFTMQIFEGEIYGILDLEQNAIKKAIELCCHNNPLHYGQVYFKEQLVNSVEKSNGSKNRVAVIGNRSHLIESMTVADNLFTIGSDFSPLYISKRKLLRKTSLFLEDFELGMKISPQQYIKDMSNLERFVVEIQRAAVNGNRLIVLDNISDRLGSEELHQFHDILKKFAKKKYTFLYIYRHHEVLQLVCDRIAIFKAGRIQKVYRDSEKMKTEIRAFAGYTYDKMNQIQTKTKKEAVKTPVLEWKNICGKYIQNLDITLYPGEIVLLLDHSNTILKEIIERMKDTTYCKTGIIEKDPLQSMLFPELSYLDNLCFLKGEEVKYFWQKKRMRRCIREEFRKELGEVLDSPHLYGANIKDLYALIYYRYLIVRPELVVCMQPLSGLDMYMRPYVLRLLVRLRDAGVAVLILGTELYDTLHIADRLIQTGHGRLIKDTPKHRFEFIEQGEACFSQIPDTQQKTTYKQE